MRRGLALLALLVACQEYPFVYRSAVRVDARTYRHDISTIGKTDLLFVVDNSASMGIHQEKLRHSMASLIQSLSEKSPNDYQVGLISTDIFNVSSESCAPCCDLDANGDGVVEWSSCDGGRLMPHTLQKPPVAQHRMWQRPKDEDLALRQGAVDKLVLEFQSAVLALGTRGSAFEAPFSAVALALDPEGPLPVRQLNWGFLRDDADLAIVFVADEDDCSFPKAWYDDDSVLNDSACYAQITDALDPAGLLDKLIAWKGDVSRVKAAAIIGGSFDGTERDHQEPLRGFSAGGCITEDQTASGQCGCWAAARTADARLVNGVPRGGDFFCNYLEDLGHVSEADVDAEVAPRCIAMPGSRYLAFLEELRRRRANLLPGVVVDSICNGDYAQALGAIADEATGNPCFEVAATPQDAEHIVLAKNGERLARVQAGGAETGWYYSEAAKQVCLNGLSKDVDDTFEIEVVTDVSR